MQIFKLERHLRLRQEEGWAEIRKGASVSERGLTKWREPVSNDGVGETASTGPK
jgi:hypothetical protein